MDDDIILRGPGWEEILLAQRSGPPDPKPKGPSRSGLAAAVLTALSDRRGQWFIFGGMAGPSGGTLSQTLRRCGCEVVNRGTELWIMFPEGATNE